ncbi:MULTISPECIES: PucR family transcriptional regulator [unclassified Oceanobacter]|jgi:sugar diacid utilization regulator|uniref:PucR family transcriptional regulator n=1 Tax=unclassified Oceanobacter TaxID=2620260 RepID=UPI0026E2B79D|nr:MULTISPECIES: PucR family transcriptional regulator [unclassified Oceanobacter]MDO6682895.1 PucR family transcriptional regulator ligand-binding domain-containing protein [Oceanobacter sp. 5_MG-2023]MDP2504975.1 PucR family transcriptional regulator ligand-binding domain-containing protein [Oceanobacter sp. 3_MG-2023]MDP2547236.1 PucR family transcriptional regulator ligand-binding domain-containing protein [Oceanobacter sp. 4_MG-2023]MDP2609345.1 PucR family transcriptional regulator ligand
MAITCADISRLPGLEEILFRAGLQGGNRPVRWPYVAENETIAPWVRGGELVFVTGINLHRSEANLKQLVQEAVEHQVAGLVILTGPEYIRRIPAGVLELANALNFPILEQPYSLKMVLVTEVISNAIVQDNLIGQSTKLFLTRLINGFADAPELIHLRAAELDLNDNRPYTVVSVRLSGFHQRLLSEDKEQHWQLINQRNELEQQFGELLKRRGIDWPVLVLEQDLIAIWPTERDHASDLAEDLSSALDQLQQRMPDLQLYAGASDLQPGLSQLSSAVEQSRQAVQFAVQHGGQRLFFYDQLGIARLFAAIPQRSLLAQFCQQQLGSLCFSRNDQSLQLKETLTQYLNLFGNQQQTAEVLGIHRNTLRHRLKRIEQLVGHRLGDAFVRLNLQNALLIEQILFQHHNIDTQPPKAEEL